MNVEGALWSRGSQSNRYHRNPCDRAARRNPWAMLDPAKDFAIPSPSLSLLSRCLLRRASPALGVSHPPGLPIASSLFWACLDRPPCTTAKALYPPAPAQARTGPLLHRRRIASPRTGLTWPTASHVARSLVPKPPRLLSSAQPPGGARFLAPAASLARMTGGRCTTGGGRRDLCRPVRRATR